MLIFWALWCLSLIHQSRWLTLLIRQFRYILALQSWCAGDNNLQKSIQVLLALSRTLKENIMEWLFYWGGSLCSRHSTHFTCSACLTCKRPCHTQLPYTISAFCVPHILHSPHVLHIPHVAQIRPSTIHNWNIHMFYTFHIFSTLDASTPYNRNLHMLHVECVCHRPFYRIINFVFFKQNLWYNCEIFDADYFSHSVLHRDLELSSPQSKYISYTVNCD